MREKNFVELLLLFKEGNVSIDEVLAKLRVLRVEEVEGIAQLDLGRDERCGIPEVILAEGKDFEHLKKIIGSQISTKGRSIISRIGGSSARKITKWSDSYGIICSYNKDGRILVCKKEYELEKTGGKIGIITAGTSDIRVAEEAKVIAEEMGCEVMTAYDVGAAGIHRLFPAIRDLSESHALVVAAGREGTLPAVVAGLTDIPVIGVPVSTGYGYMGRGEAALASMLQSCSVVSVVNIDAGFTAGAFAARIANMVAVK